MVGSWLFCYCNLPHFRSRIVALIGMPLLLILSSSIVLEIKVATTHTFFSVPTVFSKVADIYNKEQADKRLMKL